MAERCEVTELEVTGCAHCRGIKSPDEEARDQRNRLLATGAWFAAIYPGRCTRCNEPFEVGTAIRWNEYPFDGFGGWLAECCGEDGGG